MFKNSVKMFKTSLDCKCILSPNIRNEKLKKND